MYRRPVVLIGLLALFVGSCARPEPAPPVPTIEDLLRIRQTGAPIWSPDGREVAFSWRAPS